MHLSAGILADALRDAADALVGASRSYSEGIRLHRLESIDADDLADDEVHGKYSKVITSRHGFNEALTAAAWEAYPSCENGLHRATSKARAVLEEYERIGRSTRRLAYTVFSMDTFLRAHERKPRSSATREVRLFDCLNDAAGVIHSELYHCADEVGGFGGMAPATRAVGGEVPGRAARQRTAEVAAAAVAALTDKAEALRAALDAYMKSSDGGDTEAEHIAFCQLALMTATRVEEIMIATSQLVAQRSRAGMRVGRAAGDQNVRMRCNRVLERLGQRRRQRALGDIVAEFKRCGRRLADGETWRG